MRNKPAKIILSYRRADAQGVTGRIFDRLVQHYGAGSVFMDIDSIPVGVDFHDHLKAVLPTCNVFIVVIGPQYVGPRRGKPSRIMDENDWVRLELETALDLGLPVVPVLVQGASLPTQDQLPPSLHPLLRRNTLNLDMGRDFQVHVRRLIEGVDRLLGRSPGANPSIDPGSAASEPAAETPVEEPKPRGWSRLQVLGVATTVLLAGMVALAALLGVFGPREGDSETSLAGGTALTPAEDCDRWRRDAARTWDDYQNHQGSGYSVIASKGFPNATEAQEAAAGLSERVLGHPRFSVARRVERDDYVVGFGFNIPERRARELSDGLANCYDIEVAVEDPSVKLVSPMGMVEDGPVGPKRP